MGEDVVQSKWWYGVAIPAGMELIGWISARIVMMMVTTGGPSVAIVIPAISLLGSILLTPIVALSLFMDTRRIRESDMPWAPNPYLWGGLGLVAFVLVFVISTTSMMLLAVIYLLRRYTQVGLFTSRTGMPT